MAGKRLDLASVLPVGANARQRVARNVALMAQQRWKVFASGHLDTSSETSAEYKRGLVIEPINDDGYRIRLTGMKPNLIERGMGPTGIGSQGIYDVRKFLLEGRMHRAVPFRYTMAEITSKFGGAAAAAAGGLAEYNSVNRALRRQRGNLAPPVRLGAGLTPNRRPQHVLVNQSSWHRSGPKSAVFHKHASDPLAGMIRQSASYSQAGGTGEMFTVFRTASWRGKAWLSRGVRARRLNDRVRQLMADFIGRVMRQWRA